MINRNIIHYKGILKSYILHCRERDKAFEPYDPFNFALAAGVTIGLRRAIDTQNEVGLKTFCVMEAIEHIV